MIEEHQPPTAAAPREPGPDAGLKPGPFDDPRALQILNTEHWGLLYGL